MTIPVSTDYIIVRREWVDIVGPIAAMLAERIRWRGERRAHGWAASYDELSDDTGLTVKQVRTALATLVEHGFVTGESARDGTKRRAWSFALEGRSSVDRADDSSYREDKENNYLADAPLSADSEAPVMTDEPIASVTPIDGGLFPAEAVEMHGPTMDGRFLYGAWVKGYRETYGHDADASVNGPLSGAVATIAKTRTDTESWHTAYRAFFACGRRGAFDVGAVRRELAKTKSIPRDDRPRWNENTHLRMLREQQDGTPPPPMLTSRERLLGSGEGA